MPRSNWVQRLVHLRRVHWHRGAVLVDPGSRSEVGREVCLIVGRICRRIVIGQRTQRNIEIQSEAARRLREQKKEHPWG